MSAETYLCSALLCSGYWAYWLCKYREELWDVMSFDGLRRYGYSDLPITLITYGFLLVTLVAWVGVFV